LDISSGIISGTPESGGYNNITIKITDSTQPDSQQNVSIIQKHNSFYLVEI